MHDIDQEVGHFGLSDNEKGPEEVKKKNCSCHQFHQSTYHTTCKKVPGNEQQVCHFGLKRTFGGQILGKRDVEIQQFN